MRNLKEYSEYCMEMLKEIGIPYAENIRFSVNYRAKKRWGQTRQCPGRYEISINSCLLDESIKDDGLVNTILHELLHTCPDCMNHGAEWKKWADEVWKAYHIEIKRCSSADEKGIDPALQESAYRYVYRCTGCGQMVKRMRASRFTQYPHLFRCGKCGGNFEAVK